MMKNVRTDALDEYNPFMNTSSHQPAVLEAVNGGTTDVDNFSHTTNISALEKRQKELEARAQELDRREHDQNERQRLQNPNDCENNWPPLPGFCPCNPCFYQDFELDFTAESRKLIKMAYFTWLAYICLLIINIFGALIYLIKSSDFHRSSSTFGSSIILFLFLTPLSFLCWYKPLYKALKNDNSLHFFIFFIVFSLQIAIVIIQCLGFNWFASCGWINSLSMLHESKFAASVMLLISSLFTFVAVVDCILIMQVHRLYRNSSASFQTAKQEFGENAIQEPHLVNATTRAAAYSSLNDSR